MQIRDGTDGAGEILLLRCGELAVGLGTFGKPCVTSGNQLVKRGRRRGRGLRYVFYARCRRRGRGQRREGIVGGITIGSAHPFICIKLAQIRFFTRETFFDPGIFDIARDQIFDLAGVGDAAYVFALNARPVDIGGSRVGASAFFRKALSFTGALNSFLSLAGDGLFDTLIALRLEALCAGDDRNL